MTPSGELEVVEGVPDGGKIPDLNGLASAFTPEYAPEEMFEIAQKLYAASAALPITCLRLTGRRASRARQALFDEAERGLRRVQVS